jgi:hypothetical protein
MRLLLFTFFTLFLINVSSAQMAGTWKGSLNGKEATMILADAGNGNFTGSYTNGTNNWMLQMKSIDNGIDGRGKDKTAGLSTKFVGTLNDKNELTLIATTVWIDQTSEEKIVLKKEK